MQQKSYYRTIFQRTNGLKETLSIIFQGIASYPRMLLEVFIKGRFGVRYFSMFHVILLTLILIILPLAFASLGRSYMDSYNTSVWDIMWKQKLYYLFVAAFVAMAIKRHNEIKVPWGVVDPSKFTKSMGFPDRWLADLSFNNKPIDGRYREVLLEPAIFLVPGIVLLVFSGLLGSIIIFSSLIYSLSFYFAYRDGDNWVMDINDERLVAQSFKQSFVDDVKQDDNGFEYRGSKPNSKDDRERIYKASLGNDDDFAQ